MIVLVERGGEREGERERERETRAEREGGDPGGAINLARFSNTDALGAGFLFTDLDLQLGYRDSTGGSFSARSSTIKYRMWTLARE